MKLFLPMFLAFVCVFAYGQAPQVWCPCPKIKAIPAASDMLVIRKGSPFTVPAGKVLVVTGLGTAIGKASAGLQVDGALIAVETTGISSSAGYPKVRPLPPGVTAMAGQMVEPVIVLPYNSGTPVAYGYLMSVADAFDDNVVRVDAKPVEGNLLVIEQGGGPYVVPAGSFFVVTGLGGAFSDGGSAELYVNGILEMNHEPAAGDPNVMQVPPGLAIPAGTNIDVSSSQGVGRVYGYLERE